MCIRDSINAEYGTQSRRMELSQLATTLDRVVFPGGTLSTQEQAAIEPSLFLLQQGHRFKQVSFWGKIRAIERDYFICQGIVDENGKVAPFDTERATFKSTDGCVWTPLVSVDAAMAAKCEEINGYFTGDLSKIYGEAPEGDAEEGAAPADDVVTEEKRLAAFVQAVDAACAVAPTGAFVLDARHQVSRSSTYMGLETSAAGCGNWVHMRPPTQSDKVKIYEAKGLTQGTKFLDVVEQDAPLAGCWSTRYDAASGTVQLRQNVYPGFVAYAGVAPMTCFGYAYFGDGIRNNDLAFQLPQ
eukprot:TRINITY_DN10526_c0_g1_i2.p1 TRINITY_DN10526_c0_g1~~TRINITY_DN10526_c0_g1_i2.p1  ORF type:complete len:299 (-),score=68.59 TRINITY_DN10526_c0_g1_i2:388-1284(-)